MLAVEFGHLHVADDEVVVLFRGAFKRCATIEQRFDIEAFVFENVADQPRDGRFVFDYEHSRARPRTQRRVRVCFRR